MDSEKKLDTDLWLDKDLFIRQIQLKQDFWEIMGAAGNSFSLEELKEVHSGSRGIKLSKGNELLGLPYQVLDLIRDFSPSGTLNIRVLNWFGNGIYLFVHGHKTILQHKTPGFIQAGFMFCLTSSPWDYQEIILRSQHTKNPGIETYNGREIIQWYRKLAINTGRNDVLCTIIEEVKKVLHILSNRIE